MRCFALPVGRIVRRPGGGPLDVFDDTFCSPFHWISEFFAVTLLIVREYEMLAEGWAVELPEGHI